MNIDDITPKKMNDKELALWLGFEEEQGLKVVANMKPERRALFEKMAGIEEWDKKHEKAYIRSVKLPDEEAKKWWYISSSPSPFYSEDYLWPDGKWRKVCSHTLPGGDRADAYHKTKADAVALCKKYGIKVGR